MQLTVELIPLDKTCKVDIDGGLENTICSEFHALAKEQFPYIPELPDEVTKLEQFFDFLLKNLTEKDKEDELWAWEAIEDDPKEGWTITDCTIFDDFNHDRLETLKEIWLNYLNKSDDWSYNINQLWFAIDDSEDEAIYVAYLICLHQYTFAKPQIEYELFGFDIKEFKERFVATTPDQERFLREKTEEWLMEKIDSMDDDFFTSPIYFDLEQIEKDIELSDQYDIVKVQVWNDYSEQCDKDKYYVFRSQ